MININDSFNKINNLNRTYQYEEIANLMAQLIDNNVSIKEIEQKCLKFPTYDIIDYLIRYGNGAYTNAIKDYYNSLIINQNRCLLISDNHMGRLASDETINIPTWYKNEKGIYAAYYYAYKNNIHNIIHLGDLLEGNSNPFQNRISPISYQLSYLENAFPRYSDIKTYLLYGNHDYNLIYYDNVYNKFYKVCTNTELIGVNYSFINFCGNTIKLSHYCKKAETGIKNLDIPFNFTLAGHSHMYNIYNNYRLVTLPTISSIEPNKYNVGFIEMIDEENEFLFKFFDDDGIEIKAREKTLTKC